MFIVYDVLLVQQSKVFSKLAYAPAGCIYIKISPILYINQYSWDTNIEYLFKN